MAAPQDQRAANPDDRVVVPWPIIARPRPDAERRTITLSCNGFATRFADYDELKSAVLADAEASIRLREGLAVRRAVAQALDDERARARRAVLEAQARQRDLIVRAALICLAAGVAAALVFWGTAP